jgi:hypothetical protein
MATGAAWLRAKDPHLRKTKIVLTLTGLLMDPWIARPSLALFADGAGPDALCGVGFAVRTSDGGPFL